MMLEKKELGRKAKAAHRAAGNAFEEASKDRDKAIRALPITDARHDEQTNKKAADRAKADEQFRLG